MLVNENDYLQHYGVPGMRWGVRTIARGVGGFIRSGIARRNNPAIARGRATRAAAKARVRGKANQTMSKSAKLSSISKTITNMLPYKMIDVTGKAAQNRQLVKTHFNMKREKMRWDQAAKDPFRFL